MTRTTPPLMLLLALAIASAAAPVRARPAAPATAAGAATGAATETDTATEPDTEPATEPGFYDLRPYYLGTPEVAAAYDLFKEGNAAAAADGLSAAIARMPESSGDREPLQYLAAVVARAAGRYDDARVRLEGLTGDAAFADRAHLALGRVARRRRDATTAIAHFEAVRRGSPEYRRACEALVALYGDGGRRADVVRVRRQRLEDAQPDERPDALLELANALVAAGDREVARATLEALWRDHPGSDAADRAARGHGKLVRPPSRVTRIIRVVDGANGHNAGRLLGRLRDLRRSVRGREARAALDYAEGVAMVQRRKTREKGLQRLAKAWRGARKPELQGWVLLGWAEALVRNGGDAAATEKLRRLVKELPDHPAAPAGRMRLALLLDDAGDRAEAIAHLARLVERRPDHPLAPDALWWLGWLRWRNGEPAVARAVFEDLRTRFGREPCDGGASTWGERARYWEARCAEAEGRTADAVDAWATLVVDAPFTWYAHLAWSRLNEVAPERLGAVSAAARRVADPAASPADLTRLRLRRDPRLRTAVGLVRLGLYDEAIGDLEARLAAGTLPADGLVLAGALRLRTGDAFQAHRLMRRYGRFGALPDESCDAYWKLAYPLTFFGVAAEYARQFEVPPFLVMGLMRHESAFRADVRSYANAIGLMQLLPSTARSIASRLLRIEAPKARDLENPAMNLLISARFLRELDSLFRGNLALAVSAYNAGAGRVKRWLREKAGRRLDTDEFLEVLPYSNTAAYTKRVIASYAAYCFLYGDPGDPLERVRPLPRALPDELGPYMLRDEGMLGPEAVPAPPPEATPDEEARR